MGDLVPFRRKPRSTATRRSAQRGPVRARTRPAQDTGWLAAARGLGPLLLVVPLAGFSAVWLTDGPPGAGALAVADLGAVASAPADRESARFSQCSGSVRVTCVVDGDTIWYQGTKIRVADINAPEVSKPDCAREAMLGDRATARLTDLLNAGNFALVRPAGTPDRDKYGRSLRELHRNGASLGAVLVDEGLAEEWGGARIDWC
ncbi:MAG: thermonuclease family protein [Sphingomonadaceae bacterium]|nr:thermonuclease family protein [Sphingomonadaceae bacterium]